MKLDDIFRKVEAQAREIRAERERAEAYAMTPTIRRIIDNNTKPCSGGMTGAVQVFSSFIEPETYKRKAAEALYTARLIRARRGRGWDSWFARAQRMRRVAQEFARYERR